MKSSTADTAIAYYRVSTAKQGDSGLGLQAQQHSVERYAAQNSLTIIEPPYTEIETGTKKKHRPQLTAAMAAAKQTDSVLLIAKLDRLARNVHFISGLMESGIDFVAVDMPQIDNLTIHILAAVAEEEAKLISKRTKEGLAAAKRNGKKLGAPEHLTQAAREKGAAARKEKARQAYKPLIGYIKTLRYDLGLSYPVIATRLNEEGEHKTQTGKQFHAMTIKRILDREEEAS